MKRTPNLQNAIKFNQDIFRLRKIAKRNKKIIANLLCFLIPLAVLFIPIEKFSIDNFDVIQQRVLALFLLGALCWIIQPFPIYATSMLIIVLQLFIISDKGLNFLIDENVGTLIKYQTIMSTLASPIILLFLGGFFIAMASIKYRLDLNLARVLLKPFGTNPKMILLGIMLITSVFSMFMSNTATTAMMLAILLPIINTLAPDDKGRLAFILAIPTAANLGGIGTPIGTPPNAIAFKYLENISFGDWMIFSIPFVIVILILGWLFLITLFPIKTKKMELNIKGKFLRGTKPYITYITLSITVLLWIFGDLINLNSYVVATIPIGIFSITSIITKEDLKKINWDVLWLVSGGIALGLALEKTGFAKNVLASIPFSDFSPYIVIMLFSILALLMSNFMSNTASANLLMPVVAILAVSLSSLQDIGGINLIILAVAYNCSFGMALPISTPPNALAHGTGIIKPSSFLPLGIFGAIIGNILLIIMIFILQLLEII